MHTMSTPPHAPINTLASVSKHASRQADHGGGGHSKHASHSQANTRLAEGWRPVMGMRWPIRSAGATTCEGYNVRGSVRGSSAHARSQLTESIAFRRLS